MKEEEQTRKGKYGEDIMKGRANEMKCCQGSMGTSYSTADQEVE
jgi:hypothetical protein